MTIYRVEGKIDQDTISQDACIMYRWKGKKDISPLAWKETSISLILDKETRNRCYYRFNQFILIFVPRDEAFT